jgi:hypothetical protein
MVTRSQGGNVRGLVASIGLVMSTFAFAVLPGEPTAFAAGASAGLTQGFSEIVKQVTPAVVGLIGGSRGGGRGGAGAEERRCLQVPLVDHRVKKRQEVTFRPLRRCLRGMVVQIKAQDPASFLIRTDLL